MGIEGGGGRYIPTSRARNVRVVIASPPGRGIPVAAEYITRFRRRRRGGHIGTIGGGNAARSARTALVVEGHGVLVARPFGPEFLVARRSLGYGRNRGSRKAAVIEPSVKAIIHLCWRSEGNRRGFDAVGRWIGRVIRAAVEVVDNRIIDDSPLRPEILVARRSLLDDRNGRPRESAIIKPSIEGVAGLRRSLKGYGRGFYRIRRWIRGVIRAAVKIVANLESVRGPFRPKRRGACHRVGREAPGIDQGFLFIPAAKGIPCLGGSRRLKPMFSRYHRLRSDGASAIAHETKGIFLGHFLFASQSCR